MLTVDNFDFVISASNSVPYLNCPEVRLNFVGLGSLPISPLHVPTRSGCDRLCLLVVRCLGLQQRDPSNCKVFGELQSQWISVDIFKTEIDKFLISTGVKGCGENWVRKERQISRD